MRFIKRYEDLLDTSDAIFQDSRKFDTVLPRKIYAMILVLVDERKPVNYLSLYLQQDCDPFTELPASVKNALMIYTRSQLPNNESDRTGI